MKCTTRLVLCTVIPSSLFVLALGLALWSLVRTQHDFSRYIGVEQAVVTGLSEMYAQGLQSGQALRNRDLLLPSLDSFKKAEVYPDLKTKLLALNFQQI